jgi:surface antigen
VPPANGSFGDNVIVPTSGTYTVNATPRVGSVAWWDKGAGKGNYGHVGIVVAVGSDHVVVASDNYRSGASGTADVTTITRTGGAWPSGFIYTGL